MKTTKPLLALILFASATVSLAQQPSTPTAKEYSSSEGRFKVLFSSCTVNEIHGTPDTKVGKIPFHMIMCVSHTITYSVVYSD